MEDLIHTCTKFRDAIEKINKNKMSVCFSRFPRGSCRDTCLILGAFLDKNDFGVFNYVCGERKYQSHAWLEKNNIVVDITGDQFSDGIGRVYVGKRNNFYRSFKEKFRHKYYASYEDHKTIESDRLYKDYILVCNEMIQN